MTYSKNFWALTLGMFLFMTSFNLIIPELNGFITSLGGESYKGLIIGLFTVTAALSRPFSGKMADLVGRKSTMYVGTIVSIRSEEHTSELQSRPHLVCRLLLEK